MTLVRNGYSWSGGERNRFFLNGGEGRFHEISHLSGLDQIEDGRGLAIVDWDQDGLLDLWYRNRTAPRLRLMHNQRRSHPSVALRLEGTKCNRDAIGAVVEMKSSSADEHWVQSVRAGDLFLSQSSKWLHFGLGTNKSELTAKVLWPGGHEEVFTGIRPGRYHIKQGTGKARPIGERQKITLKDQELTLPSSNSSARVILPGRVPFPIFGYRDQSAKRKTITPGARATLVVLWSGNCVRCKEGIKNFAKNTEAFRLNNLNIVALSTDGVEGPTADLSAAYDLIEKTKFPFSWGFIDQAAAQKLHHFQEKLFDRTPAPSVPLAILLDQNLRALVIYRGENDIPTILSDLQTTLGSTAVQLYHLAPPLRGTWFTNPLPQRDIDRLFPAGQ
jgi:hypothetical protein